MINRKQQRQGYNVTFDDMKNIRDESRKEGINTTVAIFAKVMKKEFGFGEKRMGRVAKAIYKELEEG